MTDRIPEDVQEALGDPKREFGPYVMLRVLGRGGMGEVYLAWEKKLKRYIAIKILKDVDEEGIARFDREAQLAASLEHTHIASVYGAGHHDDKHFIIMQYIPGRTAEDICEDEADPRQAAKIGRDIALALDYAHERGVVHRDVTPRNIIVNDEGQSVLTDFGIAKQTLQGGTVTESGILVGTPGYMSPEQTSARMVDPRSDIYQLGASLFFMVTQSPPFAGTDMMQVLEKVRYDDPESPTRINPSVPSTLERIILKCLEKEPTRRYQTGKEMSEDLDRFLTGRMVQARPSGPISRWLRRKSTKISMGVAAAILVAMVVGWILAPNPPPDQAVLREAVMHYYITGNELNIGQLIMDAPDSPEKYYLAGLYYQKKGDLEKADRYYRQGSGYPRSHLARGTLKLREYVRRQTQRFVDLSIMMALPVPPVPPPEPKELKDLLRVGREEIEAFVKLRKHQDIAKDFAEGVLAYSRKSYTEADKRLTAAVGAKGAAFFWKDAMILIGISRCFLENYQGSEDALLEVDPQMSKQEKYEILRVLAYYTFTRTLGGGNPEAETALVNQLQKMKGLGMGDPSEELKAPFLRAQFQRWMQVAGWPG